LTYRAHCLGVRLRRALKKRPRYPLINGDSYSYSSVTITIGGQTFTEVGSIDYKATLDVGASSSRRLAMREKRLTQKGLSIPWPK
jgi:hypothetical protein